MRKPKEYEVYIRLRFINNPAPPGWGNIITWEIIVNLN